MMDEMIILNENALEKNDSESQEKKVFYIVNNGFENDFDPNLIGKLLPYLNMADIIQKIEVGTQYVVEIPAKYQKAFKKGDLKIMQNKKTKIHWPNLVKIDANGKKTIVSPLPVKEELVIQGNPLQELADQYAQIQLNQKLEQITEQLEEICNLGKKIVKGQTDDRIAKLESGKNLIALALTMPEGDERTIQIANARQDLSNALNAIKEGLKSRLLDFEPISQKKIERIMREIGKSGYHRSKIQEFYEIQDYFDLYLKSTKILAASYAYFGLMQTADAVYMQSIEALKTLNFSKVKTIANIQNKDQEYFFNNPDRYFSFEQKCLLEEIDDDEYLGIEVSGEKLLEVLNDGKAESLS